MKVSSYDIGVSLEEHEDVEQHDPSRNTDSEAGNDLLSKLDQPVFLIVHLCLLKSLYYMSDRMHALHEPS